MDLFAGQVFQRGDELALVLEGQHAVEELAQDVRVFAEDALEHNVAAGIAESESCSRRLAARPVVSRRGNLPQVSYQTLGIHAWQAHGHQTVGPQAGHGGCQPSPRRRCGRPGFLS